MTQFALSTIFSIRYRLLRYAPTNILLIRTHGRHGVRWFLLAVGLAAVFFYAAAISTTILTQPDRANADTIGEEAQTQYEVESMGATR